MMHGDRPSAFPSAQLSSLGLPRAPGRGQASRGGQVNCDKSVTAMMDIFPTLLNAAGGDPGAFNLDGHDILPMACGGQSPHERIFWEYNGQLAVREGRWKLVLDGRLDFSRKADDTVFLSDLSSDPSEQTNLAAREPEVAARLAGQAREWLASVAPEHAA